MPPRRGQAQPELPFLGVEIGAEVLVGTPEWTALRPTGDVVLEACLQGASIGFGTEEWFAVHVTETYQQLDGSWMLIGFLLGSENEHVVEEIQQQLSDGGIHLCLEDPCNGDFPNTIHVTRVRWWPLAGFEAIYLSKDGRGRLAKAVKEFNAKKKKEEKRVQELAKKQVEAAKKRKAMEDKEKAKGNSKEPPAGAGDGSRGLRPGGRKEEVIVLSDGEEEVAGVEEEGERAGVNCALLRKTLEETRRRILGGGRREREERGALHGGLEERPTKRAAVSRGLTSGANLDPLHASMVALAEPEVSRGSGMNRWMNKMSKKRDTGSLLLAQAVQSAETAQKKVKKDKKTEVAEKLVKLLTGKSGSKTDKEKKKKKSKPRGLLKHEPEDPYDPGDGSDDEESSTEGEAEEDDVEGSEASCEAPLKRKSQKRPGSVMEMLVRRAQEQLDQGALLEDASASAPITQGVKLTTYFGLLIRPYHPGGSPLLRELFALAQTIDLLRGGKLPQAADSLAARFMAVHTALSEGNWQVASQLELYPLEAIQSTSTATLLKAHKHRRLVLKSQGYPQGWGWQTEEDKGGYQQEKGRKGDHKGKGKGRGKGKGKDANWSQGGKGEGNPWKENKEEAAKK